MITLLRTSAVLLGGRRYWLLPLLPLAWLAVQAVMLVAGMRPSLEPVAAQNSLIGVPVAVFAIFLGGRIITGELDQHSLEIAYTVPGGAHRVWLGKLAAAILMLFSSLVLLAAVTYAFFTDFPVLQGLYGATQGVVFYLVAAMGFRDPVPQRRGRLPGHDRRPRRQPSVRFVPRLAVLESALRERG